PSAFAVALHLSSLYIPLLFCLIIPRPLRSTLFPYTTLFRSSLGTRQPTHWPRSVSGRHRFAGDKSSETFTQRPPARRFASLLGRDRKSTRLNSSHVKISYAVFCLKKKKHITHHKHRTHARDR